MKNKGFGFWLIWVVGLLLFVFSLTSCATQHHYPVTKEAHKAKKAQQETLKSQFP